MLLPNGYLLLLFFMPSEKTFPIRYWLAAARLRTLPLATATVLCGGLLAALEHAFRADIFLLCLSTALGLQIFSNLANDYGDAQNGADLGRRQGPPRMVAGGYLSRAAMRRGMLLMVLFCCVSGSLLLYRALPLFTHTGLLLWLALGTACLTAAYRYTAGNKPYGYLGGGDAAVWLFFGWVGVLGTAYLQTGYLPAYGWLAASALGLWCAMVLNLNNMRDIDSDRAAGKYTIAARLGLRRAKSYHALLAVTAALQWSIWLHLALPGRQAVFLPVLLLVTAAHLRQLSRRQGPMLDRLLPQWSLATLLWTASLWLPHWPD